MVEEAGRRCIFSSLDSLMPPQESKEVVEEAGRRCVLLPGDLATEAGCRAAVQGAVDALGRIDILVSKPLRAPNERAAV
jgi:NAD(P)-dependent dehydrogenase (short-subunit alcohol dehydrogenase family)